MDLENPSIIWDGSIPRSSTFNDIYYSSQNGLAETTHVFINNNFLAQRFSEFKKHNFCIAETGFGTGLNFLATCKLWSAEDRKQKHLDFISFEKYPLRIADITKALSTFHELDIFRDQLIHNYPKPISGFHRIHFSHNISLTLYFGDALEGLQKLSLCTQVDAWYFDGFSPKENEILWSEELFNACKQFNKEDTTFATFTSAGHVRRKLTQAGFTCEKVKGFGNKREMLRGNFSEKNKNANELPYSHKPWLRPLTKHDKKIPENVCIIGGGLAGTWTAYKLAQKNISVDIYESENEIASGASGNPRGATFLKLTQELKSETRFYVDAYLFSIRELDKLQVDKSIWDKSGLIQLLTEKNQKESFINFYKSIAQSLTTEQNEAVSGIAQSYQGIYFPDAGSVNPKALCDFLIRKANITTHLQSPVIKISLNENSKTWRITLNNDYKDYDTLVIANSFSAAQFQQCNELPLFQVRGQSTQITSTLDSSRLKTVLCAKGYLTPSISNEHTIGSTFDPRNTNANITEEDNQINLRYLKKYMTDFHKTLGEINISSAKAALRCQTPDMLPIVGELPDYTEFISDYADISKGQLKRNYPLVKHLPNLYINVAHASRGLISTPYCAEILANTICGETIACEQNVLDNLAAARFYLRTLKKSKHS